MEKDILVYVFSTDSVLTPESSEEHIINYCEESGDIYSLKGFERALNNDEINITKNFIKIIQ